MSLETSNDDPERHGKLLALQLLVEWVHIL
jgi:hypothetical protein